MDKLYRLVFKDGSTGAYCRSLDELKESAEFFKAKIYEYENFKLVKVHYDFYF